MPNLLNHYPLSEDASGVTTFITEHAAVYHLSFIRVTSVFLSVGHNKTEVENYQIIIENVSQLFAPNDPKIGATVCKALAVFFEKHPLRIVTYVCNFGDNRQLARHRKFDQWYRRYQADTKIAKQDEIVLAENNRYPVSLMLLEGHPYFDLIVKQFLYDVRTLNK